MAIKENKKRGYIRLWRSISNNPVLNDGKPYDKFHAFVDLLMMVNHADTELKFGNKSLTIRRGQRFTSIEHLAERWGWSRNKVKRFLRTTEAANMLTTRRTNHGSIVNVVNYGLYNDTEDKGEPASEPASEPANEPQTINDRKNDRKARQKFTAEGNLIE